MAAPTLAPVKALCLARDEAQNTVLRPTPEEAQQEHRPTWKKRYEKS